MDLHSKELLPAQPVGEKLIAHIYVVEDEPEPGWDGTTYHLTIRVTCIATSTLRYRETFGPLHGDPMKTDLTDDDAEDLSERLKRIGSRLAAEDRKGGACPGSR